MVSMEIVTVGHVELSRKTLLEIDISPSVPTFDSYRGWDERKTINMEQNLFKPSNVGFNKSPLTWSNVWLLAQVLIIIQSIQFASGMPIKILIVAMVAVWTIAQTNKI